MPHHTADHRPADETAPPTPQGVTDATRRDASGDDAPAYAALHASVRAHNVLLEAASHQLAQAERVAADAIRYGPEHAATQMSRTAWTLACQTTDAAMLALRFRDAALADPTAPPTGAPAALASPARPRP